VRGTEGERREAGAVGRARIWGAWGRWHGGVEDSCCSGGMSLGRATEK
jgi:hypothetical protein